MEARVFGQWLQAMKSNAKLTVHRTFQGHGDNFLQMIVPELALKYFVLR